jgi:hypothetical protein
MLQNRAARTAGVSRAFRAAIDAYGQTPATEVIQARLYATLP